MSMAHNPSLSLSEWSLPLLCEARVLSPIQPQRETVLSKMFQGNQSLTAWHTYNWNQYLCFVSSRSKGCGALSSTFHKTILYTYMYMYMYIYIYRRVNRETWQTRMEWVWPMSSCEAAQSRKMSRKVCCLSSFSCSVHGLRNSVNWKVPKQSSRYSSRYISIVNCDRGKFRKENLCSWGLRNSGPRLTLWRRSEDYCSIFDCEN